MAKTKISEFSSTPADNTDIGGIDIGEGCAPSGINNAIRTLMSDIKDLQAGTSGDTIPIAAGGTGATTAAAARTALGATTTGNSLFTAVDAAAARTTIGAGTGNGSVTSVSASTPSFLSVSGSPVTTSGTLTISYSGTALPVANGGTGLTSAGTSGNVLLSNGSEWVSGTINSGGLVTASTSGASQSIDFSQSAIHNSLCNESLVTFTFDDPASVSKVDLIIEAIPSRQFSLFNFPNKTFSITAQETVPNAIFFSADGTIMYILGQTGDDVNQYSLSTAWDVSTATYVKVFSVSAQELTSQDLFFKPDGTKMYVIGTTGDDVNEYSLSTAWDVGTASYVQVFSVSAQGATPNGLFFKSDGTKMYVLGSTSDKLHEYNLSTAWDVSSSTFLQSISIISAGGNSQGIFFKPDGLRMYIIDNGSDTVNEYNLSTAWDISTATQSSNYKVDDSNPNGVFFKSDGTEMYVIGNGSDLVYQYSLNYAWNIFSPKTVYDNKSFIAANGLIENDPQTIAFKPDGSKMYVIGSTSASVEEYTLSTNWDITTSKFSARSSDVSPPESTPKGLFFKPDGTKLYIVGDSSDNVHEYNFGIPWNLETMYFLQSFSVSTQTTAPEGLFFKPDGTKMYVVASNEVNEYSLSTAWNISTAGYVRVLDISAQEAAANGVFFNPSGTIMFVIGSTGDDVNQYSLATAWDISTASYVNVFAVTDQNLVPRDLTFSQDGTKMYVVGSSPAGVYQYNTGYYPTLVFPSSLETQMPLDFSYGKTAISLVTSDGGTSYQAINIQKGIA